MVIKGSYEREADGRLKSFLDKNELEPKDGSVKCIVITTPC